jgi:hypothetical protein
MLFPLREYDEAFRDVFSRVIRLRGEEAYPLLKEIPASSVPSLSDSPGHPGTGGSACYNKRP